jgi:hypothetical protein
MLEPCDDGCQQGCGGRLHRPAGGPPCRLRSERQQTEGAERRQQRSGREQEHGALVAPCQQEPSGRDRRVEAGKADRDVGERKERHGDREGRACARRGERERPRRGSERQG